jgi:hypothetical protein
MKQNEKKQIGHMMESGNSYVLLLERAVIVILLVYIPLATQEIYCSDYEQYDNSVGLSLHIHQNLHGNDY